MREEFELTISSEEPTSGGHNVTVHYAGGSPHMGRFSLTAVRDAVAALHELMRQTTPNVTALAHHGATLYRALFADAIGEAWRSSLMAAAARNAQLRLRIYTQQPALIAIPWEYLYDESNQRWLALQPELSLVRGLPVQQRSPQSVTGLLKVLVMVAAPTDLPALDSARELANLQAATATAAIELIPVAPTYAALQAALRQQPHGFHFIGHGFFPATADATAQGTLAFCQADGQADYIEADRLAPLLASCTSLGLVVLNACQSAMTNTASSFAGLAQRLLQQGVPAVLAMQAPILDTDALSFSREFYAALADGYGIEQAVSEGRKAIHGTAYTWGIPAFYLQGAEPLAVPQLTAAQKAERLWQRLQQTTDLAARRALVQQILALVPGHALAQGELTRLTNEEEAARLYAAAQAYIASGKWREAHRTLERVDQFAPGYGETRSLLAQAKGEIDGVPIFTPRERNQYDQYAPILNALSAGRLIPFLGWDVSRFGRPAQDGWTPKLHPPSPPEAAGALAKHLGTTELGAASLLEISQYTTLLEGEMALYERLARLYTDYLPTYFHRLLAEMPVRLRRKFPDAPPQRMIIFSTAFDDLLERAFTEAGQPYHLFAYRHHIKEAGVIRPAAFVHVPPGGTPIEILSPNDYTGHMHPTQPDEIPVIVKLCGRQVTTEPDSVMVTEDHYLDYLPAQEIGALLPMTLLNQIKRRSFLFFGYTLQPWHFRLLWQRMRYQKQQLHGRSWAIVPSLTRLDEEFWRSQEIIPIQAHPEAVVAYVNEWLDQVEVRR